MLHPRHASINDKNVGDIHINVKKKCQIGNASNTSLKSKPTMAIPFSQSSVLDSVQPDHQVEA